MFVKIKCFELKQIYMKMFLLLSRVIIILGYEEDLSTNFVKTSFLNKRKKKGDYSKIKVLVISELYAAFIFLKNVSQ